MAFHRKKLFEPPTRNKLLYSNSFFSDFLRFLIFSFVIFWIKPVYQKKKTQKWSRQRGCARGETDLREERQRWSMVEIIVVF